MKSVSVVLFVWLAFVCQTFAQTDRWIIKSGEPIKDMSISFHYPQFSNGFVYFRDGKISNALLNYNLINGEMQFISPKGDTLALSNEITIKYITIDKDSFFYDKGYVELISGNDVARLAKKEGLVLSDVKKTGAYDQSSSVSSITTVSSLSSFNQVTSLNEKKDLIISKEISYYLGDAYNHFLPANKKNLLKLFGKKQTAIENYLKEKHTSFSNEKDLKELLSFLAL